MRRSLRPLTERDRDMIAWFSAYLVWSKLPFGERGPAPAAPDGMDTTGMPGYEPLRDDTDMVLHAGLTWLCDTVQPEGAVQHHLGHSRGAADRIYGFMPGKHPVVSMDMAGGVAQFDGRDNLLNPLTEEDVADCEARLNRLGYKVIDRWNGAGTVTASFQLSRSAHPSLLMAVLNYNRGCPDHNGSVFCGNKDDGCTWYNDGHAKIVMPVWPSAVTAGR